MKVNEFNLRQVILLNTNEERQVNVRHREVWKMKVETSRSTENYILTIWWPFVF